MSETEFYLVRHGQTESNVRKRIQGQSNSQLTENGIKQAHQLGKRLQGISFDKLISSTLDRAHHTAQVLESYVKLKAEKNSSFQEISFGSAEGKTWEEVREADPKLNEDWRNHVLDVALPGGESRNTAMDRVIPELEGIAKEHDGDRILIVTHGGILAALFGAILRIPSGQRPLCIIDNTSINILRFKDDIWKLKTWGDTAHLS